MKSICQEFLYEKCFCLYIFFLKPSFSSFIFFLWRKNDNENRQHELTLLDLKNLMMKCYKKHITIIILNQARKAKLRGLGI